MARLRTIALLAAVYVVAAKLGLHLAVVNPYATAVWPSSGIALAALLLYGRSVWPGVYLGALLANLTNASQVTPATVALAAAIALGNTLEAIAGAWLTQRFAGGFAAFERARGLFRFAILAAGASTTLSAAIGVLSLTVAGLAAPRDAAVIAVTWWIGDAVGDLILAPLLILCRRETRPRWTRARAAEMAVAAVAAILLALVAFTPFLGPPGLRLGFVCTPVLLWTAFRLGLPETAATLLLVDGIALWAWPHGWLVRDAAANDASLQLQAYVGITAVMVLAIAAEAAYAARQNRDLRIVTERMRSQQDLLRLVIDGMPGLVAYIGRDYRYQFVNRAYGEWFRRPGPEIEGRTAGELAGEETFETVRPYMDRALAGEPVEFERAFRYADRERIVRARYVPDHAPDGSVRGLVVLVEDNTAEAEAVRALRESEEKFRRIVETASEGIWIVDPEGVTTFVNGRMCEMVGYRPDELVGRCCFDLIHPEDRPRGNAAFQRRKQGDTHAREYRIFRKNGEMIWVHFSGSPLRDGNGKLTAILGMCTDITERKHGEARYQALFTTSQDGILIVNDNGTYVDVNPSYCALLKSTREQLIGASFARCIPKERLADAEAAFRTLVATGHYEGEFPLLAADGAIVELEWRSIGNFVPGLHCCVARDIGDRKRFEQQMQQTQKLESLGVMAGGIAHDFNNLLVGILGNASLALGVSREPSIQPMLQDVVTAGERAAGLVRQMLAYAGKGGQTAAPTDVAALIRETVTLLKASIPKTVALQLRLDEGLPWVESDPAQLQQVIMNMVINAAEAIPENQPGLVAVSASVRRLDAEDQARSIIPIDLTGADYVEIRFTDNGCGMPPEVQRKIFDPFFTTKFTGRGLGLSAVLGIVRSHGGTLTLESTPGHGTTFRVLLPPGRGAARSNAPESSAARACAGTVLVVDDEETVRSVARRPLESCGYTVWTAGSGPESIKELSSHPETAAVVLDLAMPLMPGDQVASLLLARKPRLRIILSSGYSESVAQRRFRPAALAAFLQKPYTARALTETVAAVLRNGAGHATTS